MMVIVMSEWLERGSSYSPLINNWNAFPYKRLLHNYCLAKGNNDPFFSCGPECGLKKILSCSHDVLARWTSVRNREEEEDGENQSIKITEESLIIVSMISSWILNKNCIPFTGSHWLLNNGLAVCDLQFHWCKSSLFPSFPDQSLKVTIHHSFDPVFFATIVFYSVSDDLHSRNHSIDVS